MNESIEDHVILVPVVTFKNWFQTQTKKIGAESTFASSAENLNPPLPST